MFIIYITYFKDEIGRRFYCYNAEISHIYCDLQLLSDDMNSITQKTSELYK